MLTTVVLLNIFLNIVILFFFFFYSLMNIKFKRTERNRTVCNIDFTNTFDKFNAPFINKSTIFFFKSLTPNV